ncbi:MAG: enoyl-CoA hydratase [Dehalococcoidia bacterium]|jgi:2-(1,2-epoxy-1,2-dihydrophenyl)acetyl-CoA isomerase|nr:enoyl-CoA hydratase [Dehalococcoidia bacterium]MEE2927720.1 enoyl-CoA hydratase [Chloroflexota bacterium]HIB13545.1 enoyl-CoA hydratase [Dehalococcoidia bacterium]|tara:strand:+ start:3215 stop:4018 length:804 start_codon:yes stop_codon:yes gene_type:complete
MAGGLVDLSNQGAVGIITLNRPEARNALNPEMFQELGSAIQGCRDPDMRAVIITGSGGSFCAGADVKDFVNQLENSGPEGLHQHLKHLADAFHRHVIIPIRQLDKPVIASIDGVAAGGGLSLALACDLRVASDSARFLMAYGNIGATADGGSTYLLPRLIGTARAMELYLSDQPIGAQRALDLGLLNQVFPTAELERSTLEFAARLAQGPTVAYGRVKALFDSSWDASLAGQLDAETEYISNITMTDDFQEGIKAFAEKRSPRFQGR